jgi:hypothetical protein
MKFLISEEEKSRILNMHQNATSRQYLSEQAIYNWEGDGRKIKYKVQGNKYYTSRDEGKTWTELTKQQDIDWVKTNAIKPENLDKSAKTTSTAPGPAVTVGQSFPVTDAAGNQLLTVGYTNSYTVASKFTGSPVKAKISSIKFGTRPSGDYVLLGLSITAYPNVTPGSMNYTVDCYGGAYGAQITQELDDLRSANMSQYYYVMSNNLQADPNKQIGQIAKNKNFFATYRDNNLNRMNKNLADSVVSYFCDGSKLRAAWKAKIGQ